MPFSQIFPPSPSPTESIRLFYTSVSLLLSRTQGYWMKLEPIIQSEVSQKEKPQSKYGQKYIWNLERW